MFCSQSIYFEVHWAFLYLIFPHSIINILCSVPSTRTAKVLGTLGAARDGEGLCAACRGLQRVLGGFAQAISIGAGGPRWCVLPWFHTGLISSTSLRLFLLKTSGSPKEVKQDPSTSMHNWVQGVLSKKLFTPAKFRKLEMCQPKQIQEGLPWGEPWT